MSLDARMQKVADTLQAQFPARGVTRAFLSHEHRRDAELKPGLYTVIAGGVKDYPYETSGLDSPRSTDMAVVEFAIAGQIKLAESSTGQDVEQAELAMLAELEDFADAAMNDDDLVSLQIRGATLSQQQESPYGWIYTRFTLTPWE